MDLVAVQVETRRNNFELIPLAKMDDVLAQEFLKGEISAFRLMQHLVESRVNDLEAQIDELEQELDAA